MAAYSASCLIFFFFFFFINLTYSKATSVPSKIPLSWLQYASTSSSSRHVLQLLRSCPLDFAAQNYTILTSQCKPPDYPRKPCCTSFLEFSCPFADQLNDNTTDCAQQMFNYIHNFYPSGLFANECSWTDDTSLDIQGLECPDQDLANISGTSLTSTNTSTSYSASTLTPNIPPSASHTAAYTVPSSCFINVLWQISGIFLIIAIFTASSPILPEFN